MASIEEILPIEDRQVWVTAFWGFAPEESGLIGFTRPKDRDDFFDKCRDGDLVLIYGANSSEVARRDVARALGFLEIRKRKIEPHEKMSDTHLAWKKEVGKQDSWNYCLEASRAWRVDQEIAIKNIIKTNQNIAVRGALLESQERDSALALTVTQVNVYGEPPVTETASIKMQKAFKGPKGLPAIFDSRTSERTDGIHYVYMLVARGPVAMVLDMSEEELKGRKLVKVGYSKNPEQRCKDFNDALPDSFAFRWELAPKVFEFENGELARNAEKNIHERLCKISAYQGKEFFLGDINKIINELHLGAGEPVIYGRTIKR